MKKINLFNMNWATICIGLIMAISFQGVAQETATTETPKSKPVKNTFESNWIIDNQTVMVPVPGTFEMDILHRFGTINNGYEDLFGIYAPSNIRMGFSYVVFDNLQAGFGFTKERLQWDVNYKYAILKQTQSKGWPVSVTYFGNIVIDTRKKSNFVNGGDRISYFNQLMIARKFTDKISVQVAPSYSHYNNVEGYLDENGEIQKKMKNDHFGISFMGRYKFTSRLAIILNYDQALSEHTTNNPSPNLCGGIEISTSSHAFQVFFGNSQAILPQNVNYFNQNEYKKSQYVIGFNITRLWN